MCLKWFKGNKKEKRGIIGKITKTEYTYRGIVSSPVALFSLETEGGQIKRLAMNGHVPEPKTGDRVEVFLGEVIANKDEFQYEKQGDGSLKKVGSVTRWSEITRYKILDDGLPKNS